MLFDFSDAYATIKHSVLENHSSLIFCNSIFCPFLCFFYSANSLPLTIVYFLNVGLIQEIPSHFIIHTYCCLLLHNSSKFSYVQDFQISLKNLDSFHIKKNWNFQQLTHWLYKLKAWEKFTKRRQKYCNFVSNDPGCHSGSGVALGKFLRFVELVSSIYIKA